DRPASQRLEDASYWAVDELQQRWTKRLRAGFRYEAAHFLGLRGWVVAECLLNADVRDPFPWRIRLLDPLQIYPDTDDGAPGLVVPRYQTTYAALENYWGKAAAEKAFATFASYESTTTGFPSQQITCYGFYTPTELAIAVEGGDWLKPPVEHGYGELPLVLGIGPGAPYRAVEQGDDQHTEYIGTSLLRTLKGVVDAKHRIAMLMRRVLTKTGAPPLFAALSDPNATADDIATEPNEVTIGRPGDGVT